MEQLPKLISAVELGKRFSINKNTIYSWARRKMIPCYRLGELVRFDPQEVLEWMRNRHQGGR